MTNHWADIANSTCVIAWGANPAQNHPACIAHVNRARFPKQFFASTDPRASKKEARLIVVDPRKTHTALQIDTARGDRYIRIRPGTDIALVNGIVRYIMENMEGRPGTIGDGTDLQRDKFFAHLNYSKIGDANGGRFWTDGSSPTGTSTLVDIPDYNATTAPQGGFMKYTDARFLVNTAGTDYQRAQIDTTGNLTASPYTKSATTISDWPLRAETVLSDANTVYNRLKKHVSPYTLAVVADICGCNQGDIIYLATEIIANSRCSSWADSATMVTDARDPKYRTMTMLYAMGITQHTCGGANVNSFAVLQTLMGNMGRAGGGINALRGIHNVQGSTDMGLLYGNIPAYSGNPTNAEADKVTLNGTTAVALAWKNYDNTAVTVTAVNLDGLTAYAASDYDLAVDGSGFTTIARSATSTIPDGSVVAVSYTHNVASGVAGPAKVFNAYGKYVDNLWGNPVSGTGTRTNMNKSYDDAYTLGALAGLQQRGFVNMSLKWFGDYTTQIASLGRAQMDAVYSLWPKGNGDNHITMFRKMAGATPKTKAALVWGQNPAVTEPNQGAVRAGLYNLDLLVVVDQFETETAGVARKAVANGDASDGVTFLLPTCAYTEKAGSATNSGRTLQWRYKAVEPAGATKDDTEYLLRLAEALDTAGAFSHIGDVWAAAGIYGLSAPPAAGFVYDKLYKTPYLGGAASFAAAAATVEMANMRLHVDDAVTYNTAFAATGSEAVAELVYREMMSPNGSGGTLWIYTAGYSSDKTTNKHTGQTDWSVANRAKSRDRWDGNNQFAFPGWGYAWLVNRRVFYNNGDVPGDVRDYFMGPDSVSRMFTSNNAGTLNYSRWYRTIHRLNDKPSVVVTGDTTSPHYAGTAYALTGRFPGHVEPYESPRQDLVAKWGRNTNNGSTADHVWNLVPTDTKVAGRHFPVSQFPLVLTTIRCVEHFQGGPITRNNWWNVDLEPEPWIEINLADATKYGITDGCMVKIVTARTEDLTGDMMPLYGQGFRARVGAGLSGDQRVGPGVVAIPWHWGDKGLSTGSRANDLCIDAMDANTTIPEYKACLCRVEKMA